jgi:esterase/lipase superfamily enzyme
VVENVTLQINFVNRFYLKIDIFYHNLIAGPGFLRENRSITALRLQPTERLATMTRLANLRNLLILPIALFSLAGCQHAVYLMPAPVGIKAGKHDPFAHTPEERKSSNILIGYATNRTPIGAKESRFYGRDFDADIRLGVAEVQIGDGNQGWDEIYKISLNGARLKTDTLLTLSNTNELGVLQQDASLDQLTPDLKEIFDRFNKAIAASPTKDITIYAHGANNSFYRTASQAAQYRHFTGRQAIVVLFSWPSAESILRYGTDVRHINKTVPTFVRFIKLLAKHTNARKINILAYSAGASLTTKSLAMLGQDTSVTDRSSYRDSLRLGTIYFAAPDTDFDAFVDEYRSYQDIVDSVTVTVNQYDTVLGIAREEHYAKNRSAIDTAQDPRSGKSRLGKPDLADISAEEADWLHKQTRDANFYVIYVDPKVIPGMTKGSHDYWYQNAWASTDALIDLNFRVAPAERGLEEFVTDKNARLWFFPADYEERIEQAIAKLREQFWKDNKLE